MTALFTACLLVFSLQQVTVFHVLGSGMSLGTLAILVVVAGATVWMLRRHGIPKGLRLPLFALVAACLALALSVLASDRPFVALPFAVRYGSELALVWVLINVAVAFPGSGRAMARATIWFFTVALIIGAGSYFGHDGVAAASLLFHNLKALEFYSPRASAIYEHPGIFAAIGIIVASLALHLKLRGALSNAEAVLATLMAAAALILAQTRNPLLAVALLGLFFLVFGRRNGYAVPAWLWPVSALAVAGALVLMYRLRYDNMALLEYSLSNLDRISSGRLDLWAAAFQAWQDRPWLGTGPGVFEQLVPAYTEGRYPAGEIHGHNLILFLLSETGVVGLLAGVGLVYALWAPLLKSNPGARDRFLILSWLVLLLGFGIADFYFHSYGFAMHCAVAVAFLYGEYVPLQRSSSAPTSGI